jgi:hypothetical protein
MVSLREFFEHEARRSLAQLEQQLAASAGPDPAELYHAVRGLRGAAQMAREDLVHRGAVVFEAAARTLMNDALVWSPDIAARARATVDDLHGLTRQDEDETQRTNRLASLIERWRSVGVEPPAHPVSAAVETTAEPVADDTAREFRDFVAREVAAIADALEAGVQQLLADPMDRAPLRLILRRQRALLGAARLDEVPIIGEILRAVEDLTRVIAKLNVGTKHEWLDIYRVAFEALRASLAPLAAGLDPLETHAVKRLRHMREELLERYGSGEVVSAAADENGGLVQAQPFAPGSDDVTAAAADETSFVEVAPFTPSPLEPSAPEHVPADDVAPVTPPAVEPTAPALVPADDVLELSDELVVETPPSDAAGDDYGIDQDDDIVPIDELVYRGAAAVQRASELRDAIAAAAADPRLAEAADELLDLVRLNAE